MRILTWVATLLVLIISITILAFYGLPQLHKNKQFSHKQAALDITRFTLSNGMDVILVPNDRVPAVSHMLWLRLGSADDPPGKSGLAHYLEHLMFKGTPTVPDGEYSKRLTALGGNLNAFTGSDFTGYYVNIAKEHLPLVMQMEADRFQQLDFSDEVAEKEHAVIIEERQSRLENDPVALWSEQMQATLFQHHPYRIPIIGWMHEMQTLTAQDARNYYHAHYHPGNMVLVVAGDMTRAELEPLAEQYYGAMKARPSTRKAWAQEPPSRAAKTVTMRHAEVHQPRWQRRYLVPSYGTGDHDDVMALSLLAEWLGGGKTSLLYEQLVQEQKLAVSVSASYSGMKLGPASFVISATPAQGVTLKELQQAVDKVIVQAKQNLIAPDDLGRIKTLFKASVIYAQDGLEPLAHYAGYLAMLDLPMRYITQWEDMVEAVTAEKMQQMAKSSLKPMGSVTGYLYPEDEAAHVAK